MIAKVNLNQWMAPFDHTMAPPSTVDSLSAENGRLHALLVSEAMAIASLAEGLSQAHAQLVQSVDTMCKYGDSEMPLSRADVQMSSRHVVLYCSFLRHTAELARSQSDAVHAHVAEIRQKMDTPLEVKLSSEASAAMQVAIPLGGSTTGASVRPLADRGARRRLRAVLEKHRRWWKRAGPAWDACLPWCKSHVDVDARAASVVQLERPSPSQQHSSASATRELSLRAPKPASSAASSAAPSAAPSAAASAAPVVAPPGWVLGRLDAADQPAAADAIDGPSASTALPPLIEAGAKGQGPGSLLEAGLSPVSARPASPVTQAGLGSLAHINMSDVRAEFEQIQLEVAASMPASSAAPVPRLRLGVLPSQPAGEADLPTHRGARGRN